MPELDFPKIEYIPSFVAALREGFRLGIGHVTAEEEISEIENNPQKTIDEYNVPKSGTRINEAGIEVERIPEDDFWYVDGNEFIGRIRIRHYLTPELLNDVGHIGYGIRPSRQNQGHATDMLKLVLEHCKNKLGLDKVLITCDINNQASARVIEKAGGVLEDIRKRGHDDEMFKRYWITL